MEELYFGKARSTNETHPTYDQLRQQLAAAQQEIAELKETKMPCGEQKYPLNAYIWKRESTNEWVLEISGNINGCDFTTRHSMPISISPENVCSLDHLYENSDLAASQAREQKLREALGEIINSYGWSRMLCSKIAEKALSTPSDNTALREKLGVMAKRCIYARHPLGDGRLNMDEYVNKLIDEVLK